MTTVPIKELVCFNAFTKNWTKDANARWQQLAAKLTDWFAGGQTRYFESRDAALAWLREGGDA